MKADIFIAGSGCSGLYAALNLPADKKIVVITKRDLETNDSFLAQGGMCVLKDESDYDNFYEDTMKAGHYENDPKSVEIMIKSSQDVLKDLIGFGATFATKADGTLDYTKEGGHSGKRIVYHEDITGKEITSHLLAEAKKRPNITLIEYAKMIDILERDNVCYGVIIRKDANMRITRAGKKLTRAEVGLDHSSIEVVKANYVVLATGGIGGLYRHSTNFRHLTGDSLAIAIKHGIELRDINYVQIHPTTFYSEHEEDRSFLISESVRGEGAKLYDKNMERFVDELIPRDRLTAAIRAQMEKDDTLHVWEDMRPIPKEEQEAHFPNIVGHCREKGYEPSEECIPVVPAQHYFMGGIKVNHESKTSMDRLYAVGETACNGVHGRNRLASNSLLESMVFAKRAAKDIADNFVDLPDRSPWGVDMFMYSNDDALNAQYRKLIRDEIKKADKKLAKEQAKKKLEAQNGSGANADDDLRILSKNSDFKNDKEYAKIKEEKMKKNKRRTNMFDPVTLRLNVDPLIEGALKEDISSEDVSTNSVMPKAQAGEVDLICKEDGIICGLQVFERTFTILDPETKVEFFVSDGDEVKKGQLMAKVHGDIRTLLCGERTALNYLQRMSGVATYTNKVAKLLEGSKTKLLDTRKTTPNNRIFEKYAVRCGGGNNHRYNLSDGVMLKDNHIGAAGGVKEAIAMAKAYAPFVRKIEVEVENLEMVKDAVEAGAHIIMLDNMSHEMMEEAMKIIDGRAEVEISGNVTKENIAKLVDIGVDFISSGALTHSSPILDISLKNLHPVE